jgi:zinc transport system permease protein
MGYLIGDVFAASTRDLMWIACGGALALTALARLWPKLLMLAIHSELAEAEGIDRDRTKAMFVVLLAVVVAVAIKIVGLLLVVAIFIMPATAARTFAATPERMVLLAAAIGVGGALAGLALSVAVDVPGGPAIVLVLAAVAALALTTTGRRAGPTER